MHKNKEKILYLFDIKCNAYPMMRLTSRYKLV
jgi:hypothetical protein